MVNTMEVQFQRFLAQGCILCFREFASLYHLLQHYITAFATTIRFTNRIEVRRVFTHADQRGALGNGKVFWRFSEINVRRRLYAYGIMQKIEIIEIECQYLFLGIMTFKFYCNHPFHRFCTSRCMVLSADDEYNCFASCCVMVLPPPAPLCPKIPRLITARNTALASMPE